MRLFDRAGLTLVPVIESSTPLVELERLIHETGLTEGIEPVSKTKERMRDVVPTLRGQGVHYNALDPRVQLAVRHVADEVVNRYRAHPAFAGLAFQVGPRRYTQLPEANWTMDPATLGRFRASQPGNQPREQLDQAKLAEWAATTARPEFLQWRSQQMAEFLSTISRSMRPQSLYLLTSDYSLATGDATIPELEYGWDWETLAGQENLIPIRYCRSRPLANFVQQLADGDVLHDVGLDRRFDAVPLAGSLLMVPPEMKRIAGLEKDGPWATEQLPQFLLPHATYATDDARLSLARTLLNSDRSPFVVGGWAPPRGQESSTRQWFAVYQQLPAQRFESVAESMRSPNATNPLFVVRRLKTDDALYVYAINAAPWTNELKMELDNPGQRTIQWLGQSSLINTVTKNEVTNTVRRPVLPGDLVAFRIDDPAADIKAWQAAPLAEDSLLQQLAERLRELSQAATEGSTVKDRIDVGNADFEAQGDAISGWLTSQHPSTSVTIDSATAAAGKRSLRMESKVGADVARTWALSQPLPMPKSGRILLTARVRIDSKTPQASVRMAVEARVKGQTWRRALVINSLPSAAPALTLSNSGASTSGGSSSSASSNDPAAMALTWPAAAQRLEILDLPVTQVEELRVAFDLVGPGTAWVDDVQLSNLTLTQSERTTLQEDIYLAVQHIKNGNPVPAGRIFSNTWTRELLGLPRTVPQTIKAPAEPTPPVANPKDTPASTAERLRSWLPRIVR